MRMNRKSVALVLAMLLLCNLVLMTACTSNETPGTTHASDPNYQVKVTDAQGKPYTTGVIVQFVQDGKQVAMQPVNAEGIAQKVLPADEYQIEEVVTNYVSNALNHIDYDKIITVTIEKNDNIVKVLVHNTGKNIPEEDIDKVWIKFYKVDKARTREYGGNGIGLSIVKAVMEAHNRKCGVFNTPDGVTFWFELDCQSTID